MLVQPIMFLTCILEVPGSNLGRDDYTDLFFTVFLSMSRQMPHVTFLGNIVCRLHSFPTFMKSITRLKSTIFWDITPCSPLKVNRRFGGTYSLHLQGRRIRRARNQCESRWQADSSETPVDTQWTTRRYIPEDGTFHNHLWRTSNPT
jgi:hypothetical protein